MAKNLLVTIFTFCFVLILSQKAFACSCSSQSVKSAFLSADAVFVGKVSKIKTVKKANVSLLMKESGTLELLETPRWRKSTDKVRSVLLEIIKSYKGATEKAFVLTTADYNGGGSCGVSFDVGEKFLVFAHKTNPFLAKEVGQSKENRTLEMRLKSEADEFNKQLPLYQTNICAGTDRLSVMNEEIKEIRKFLKNGVWKERETSSPFMPPLLKVYK